MPSSGGSLLASGEGLDDVTTAEQSEDAFDALVTAVGLLRCVLEETPLSDPTLEDRICEGGILGSGSVDLKLREQAFTRPAPKVRPPTSRPRATKAPATASIARSGSDHRCPIPGCSKVFRGSHGGWNAHVASLKTHAGWHPELRDGEQRKERFRQEYLRFLERRSPLA